MFNLKKKLYTSLQSELVALVIGVFMLEVLLRVFPQIIPLALLQGFEFNLRANIAAERGLNTQDSYYEIRSAIFPITARAAKPFSQFNNDVTNSGQTEQVIMDENGFCNQAEFAFSVDTPKIVAIGDSFTWCTRVSTNETWPALLGAYNLGQSGTGPYHQLIILENFGLQKNPDYVVMAVYEGNDLRDSVSAEGSILKAENEELYVSTDVFPCKVRPVFICKIHRDIQEGWVGQSSYTYSVVSATAKLLVSTLAGSASTRLEDGAGIYSDFRYSIQTPKGQIDVNSENKDVDELGFAERQRQGDIGFDSYDGAFSAYADLSAEYDFVPIVLYIPAMYTTYQEFVTFADPRVSSLMSEFSMSQRKYLDELSNKLNLVFIDSTPDLQKIASENLAPGELLYFTDNLHPTPFGHITIADLVLSNIE